MNKWLRGNTLAAQARLPDGRQVIALAIDREGLGNLLDRPGAFARLEVPDLLGTPGRSAPPCPFTLLILTGEAHDPALTKRIEALIIDLTETRPAPTPQRATRWTTPNPEDP